MKCLKTLLLTLTSLALLAGCNKNVVKEKHKVAITQGTYYSMILVGDGEKGFEENQDVVFFLNKANDEVVFKEVYYGITEGTLVRKYPCTAGTDNSYSFLMPNADVKIYADIDETKYNVTFTQNDNVTCTVLERNENKAFAGETVSVKVELKNNDCSLDSVTAKCGTRDIELTKEENEYTFLMPKGEVVITASTTDLTHKVNINASDYLSVTINGGKDRFVKNSSVTFTVSSSNSNYGVDTVKVMNGSSEVYVSNYTSYYLFTMPDADVTIVTTTKKLTHKVNVTENENVTVTLKDDIDEYLPKANVEFEVEITNKDYELDVISIISGSKDVVYTGADGKYSFEMPDADVTISVTAKEKGTPIPTNPFQTKTVFEGEWDYNDGYTLYYMTMRVEIDSTTLSWKLSYEYDDYGYDDYWSFKPLGSDVKNSQSNLSYTYDGSKDQVIFMAKPKVAQKQMTLQINRVDNVVKSIQFTENMDSDYYQTKNHVLLKK